MNIIGGTAIEIKKPEKNIAKTGARPPGPIFDPIGPTKNLHDFPLAFLKKGVRHFFGRPSTQAMESTMTENQSQPFDDHIILEQMLTVLRSIEDGIALLIKDRGLEPSKRDGQTNNIQMPFVI